LTKTNQFLVKAMTVTKKEIVQLLLDKDILITPGMLKIFEDKDEKWIMSFYNNAKEQSKEQTTLLLQNLQPSLNQQEPNNQSTSSQQQTTVMEKLTEEGGNLNIVFSHQEEQSKKSISDFVLYFNARYKLLERMLRNRQELHGITSINRANQKDERETVSVIGLVKSVHETKNGNLMLTLEDPTGEIKVLVNGTKKDMFTAAKTLVPDEVIGVLGVSGKGIIFANNIIWPDIPVYNELKKCPNEEYAVFISDIHVGSKNFMKEDFQKFIIWTRGDVGSEKQKAIVNKLKYIFIVGDMVDGVSIYPGQESDLEISDIKQQYEECARILDQVPKHIKIIIIPGNHDAMRLAEPQLPLYEDYAEALYNLENVTMLSNPAIVNIGKCEGFPGLNILLYHGYSFDWYIATVDEIRNNGGYDRADLVMKFMLKRRHLAPTHASCLYIPFVDDDPLIIKKIPDIFATGHLHKVSVSNYRNVTLIGASCWQKKTSFQEKMGHHPEPARVPLVNLKTREVKILKFGDE
jgi:DNA polymerase II small subunit